MIFVVGNGIVPHVIYLSRESLMDKKILLGVVCCIGLMVLAGSTRAAKKKLANKVASVRVDFGNSAGYTFVNGTEYSEWFGYAHKGVNSDTKQINIFSVSELCKRTSKGTSLDDSGIFVHARKIGKARFNKKTKRVELSWQIILTYDGTGAHETIKATLFVGKNGRLQCHHSRSDW
jgi:hypothetical protein